MTAAPSSPPAADAEYIRAWQALRTHADIMRRTSIARLFANDPERVDRLGLEVAGVHADFAKQRVGPETLELLATLAQAAGFQEWRSRLFSGDIVNPSEARPALHPLLRARGNDPFPADTLAEALTERIRMLDFARALRAGSISGATGRPINALVNLGIGGSDLGPRLVTHALDTGDTPVAIRYAANADPADLEYALRGLDPHQTLFVIASKTFTTVETLDNARRARAWLASSGTAPGPHFVAVTADAQAAAAWGVDASRIFGIHDGVGGRYSLWSAAGLAAAVGIGPGRFSRLLEGAREMDLHFRAAPVHHNLPLRAAMIQVWNAAFLDTRNRAVLAYSEALRDLPGWLAQLEMESLGKRVDRDGIPLGGPSAPFLIGGVGTPSQHSFHQMLHQGTDTVPVEFVVPLALPGDADAQRLRVNLAIAQGAALLSGTLPGTPSHRACPGDRPSTTVTIPDLRPESLGTLLAFYEHATFCAAILWRINPFDQWGVELGKQIARDIGAGVTSSLDPSSTALLARARLV